MLKKTILLAAAAAAVIALAAPAASADWYHSGEKLESGENASLSFTGTIAFTSPNGGVHCPEGFAILEGTGGTGGHGHVKAFAVETVSNCHVSGALAFLAGGTNSLVSTQLTGSPTLQTDGHNVRISGVTLHNTYKSGLKLTLSSGENPPLTAKPNNPSSIGSGTLSGTLNNSLGGTVTVTGNLTVVKNANTYGVTP